MRRLILTIVSSALLSGCAGQMGSLTTIDMDVSGPPETLFTIHDKAQLIGGPLATGRLGDILLKNDKIRLIIEQPGKDPWVGNFGGTIIDADLVRENRVGQDNFGYLHPLINVEWTVNVFDYEVVKSGEDGGPVVFRTFGQIDVYDYLDLDFISPVGEALTGQVLHWNPAFDDVNDPFNLTELRNINTIVVTNYTLEPGKNYVKIDTTIENTGGEDVYLPFGEFINGSGEVMSLIPGLGFTPDMMSQIKGETPALIYVGFPGTDVSYGYFFDPKQFTGENEDGEIERFKTTSLSYSGVTGVLLGEEFIKVLPLGSKSEPKVNFFVPAHDSRTVTRYFVVGDGNSGTVFDAGLGALGISTNSVSGVVNDGDGRPVPGATVAVKNESDSTIITYRTDSKGRFSGNLSSGRTIYDQTFGSGRYKLSVYKKGYRVAGGQDSGTCNPQKIDLTRSSYSGIECKLGEGGVLNIVGGVLDADTGKKIPARMTVAGYVPEYKSETGGDFEDKVIFERPLGVVDIYYVSANGTVGLDEVGSVRLAPGKYELFFTRGVEYSMERIPVDIAANRATSIGPVTLEKLIDTAGYISADFHLHSIVSPDSAMSPERRTLAAAGEGMDVLQSSDHDYLVDYGPYVDKLSAGGVIESNRMLTIVGQEISPNHIGHINAFPLEYYPDRPCGGALDWSYTVKDIAGPDPDFVMSPQDVVDYLRSQPEYPIIQINHISDLATSILIMTGWVTSPFYYESHGVEPLSSYADPVMYRIQPKVNSNSFPLSYGTSDLVITDFDTVELTIGPELHDDFLIRSALPQWFNLLNLGLIVTATSDSDSHREMANALGIPRNFVASKVDVADGMGSLKEFDTDKYLEAIRGHNVIVTTGPFVKSFATNSEGSRVTVGETITGRKIKFSVDVKSPDWAWFDTVEIYTNTEPIPADDENYMPLEGKAKDPAEFYAPYHLTRYYYEPDYSFSLKDKTLENWKSEGGVITASVEVELELEKDTWVVVFVKGTEGTEGYRSLFPFVTHALVDADNPSVKPEDVDAGNIDMLTLTGAPAWAFTNPIFIDVDGNGFNSLYSDQWDFSQGRMERVESVPEETKSQKRSINKSATTINVDLF